MGRREEKSEATGSKSEISCMFLKCLAMDKLIAIFSSFSIPFVFIVSSPSNCVDLELWFG